MKYTTSFHQGTEVRREHNIRNPRYVRTQKHIEQNGLFEVWKDKRIDLAYQEIFGEALNNYNKKQKRTDRKIRSYLEQVRQDKKKKPCYEVIFQIGNEQNSPSVDVAKNILKQFSQDFEKRNPNLKVIGVYFHADEKTPHCHLDFIPVAHGYKQGLEIQTSLTKALNEQGFFNKKIGKKYDLAVSQFARTEREELSKLCRERGIEIENPKRSPAEYESSKMMRKARDKSLELAKREAVIKDKEQEADMKLNIAQFVLKKAEQNHNAKDIILDLQNKMISQEKELQRLRYKDTLLRQLAKENKKVTLSNALSAYDAEMQQSKLRSHSKQASIER